VEVDMPVEIPTVLPESLHECHALIVALKGHLEERERRIDHLVRQLFASKSERIDPNQLSLFHLQNVPAPAEPEGPAVEDAPAKPRRKGHGRKPFPDDLPRKRVEHDVAAEDKVCPECGAEKIRFGEDISEQLDYIPASLYVVENVRPKYACPCCQEHVSQAAKPVQPIEKGTAGPGLIAHVLTSKYCDHVPLHRQEKIFKRHGIDLSRKTLCGWTLQSAAVLAPVVAAMTGEVLKSRVIHTDDTPVQVQDPEKKRSTRKAYLWPYLGDADHPYTVFDYTPTRSREGPAQFLNNFTGSPEHPRYLQCDAYPGYDRLFAGDRHLLEVGCWAHARRKFHDAKDSDPVRAHQAMLKIGELYAVERDAKDNGISGADLRALRQEKARPLLDGLYTWLIDAKQAVLPKSPVGKAVDYALSNWTALNRYTDHGFLAIDNNAAERAVRAIAVGRKNWLFFGSDQGGHAAAIHFSLIASAQRHGLDPFAYLRDLLIHLPTWPQRAIHDLLPDRWKQRTQTD
jgi:transposase